MRLLLLLSAILSALTGVAGSRPGMAHPVAASAPASAQTARAQAGAVAIARALVPLPGVRDVAGDRVAPVAVTIRRVQPLYADRLRE